MESSKKIDRLIRKYRIDQEEMSKMLREKFRRKTSQNLMLNLNSKRREFQTLSKDQFTLNTCRKPQSKNIVSFNRIFEVKNFKESIIYVFRETPQYGTFAWVHYQEVLEVAVSIKFC